MDLLNNIKYDEVKGVRDHIMLLYSYYNKLKGLKMDIGEEFLTYSIMKNLPFQFDNIRSSLNTKKEGCSLEELTVILIKEEDDIKLNRSRSVAMVSHQVDNSSLLWHKSVSTCVECVKGKLTSKVRKDKITRCGDVLELIHIDLCGPFTLTSLGGYRHFIAFIDDFSHYGHVELICQKLDYLVTFKVKMEF